MILLIYPKNSTTEEIKRMVEKVRNDDYEEVEGVISIGALPEDLHGIFADYIIDIYNKNPMIEFPLGDKEIMEELKYLDEDEIIYCYTDFINYEIINYLSTLELRAFDLYLSNNYQLTEVDSIHNFDIYYKIVQALRKSYSSLSLFYPYITRRENEVVNYRKGIYLDDIYLTSHSQLDDIFYDDDEIEHIILVNADKSFINRLKYEIILRWDVSFYDFMDGFEKFAKPPRSTITFVDAGLLDKAFNQKVIEYINKEINKKNNTVIFYTENADDNRITKFYESQFQKIDINKLFDKEIFLSLLYYLDIPLRHLTYIYKIIKEMNEIIDFQKTPSFSALENLAKKTVQYLNKDYSKIDNEEAILSKDADLWYSIYQYIEENYNSNSKSPDYGNKMIYEGGFWKVWYKKKDPILIDDSMEINVMVYAFQHPGVKIYLSDIEEHIEEIKKFGPIDEKIKINRIEKRFFKYAKNIEYEFYNFLKSRNGHYILRFSKTDKPFIYLDKKYTLGWEIKGKAIF